SATVPERPRTSGTKKWRADTSPASARRAMPGPSSTSSSPASTPAALHPTTARVPQAAPTVRVTRVKPGPCGVVANTSTASALVSPADCSAISAASLAARSESCSADSPTPTRSTVPLRNEWEVSLRASAPANCKGNFAERTSLLVSGGQRAQHGDQTADTATEVLDRDPFVGAVDGLLLVLCENERHEAVALDAVLAEVVAVREAGCDARDDRRATELATCHVADGGRQPRIGVRGRGREGQQRLDRDRVVADHVAQLIEELRRLLTRQEAAIEVRARLGRNHVRLGAAFEDRRGDRVADQRVLPRVARELREEDRVVERGAEMREPARERLLLEPSERREVGLHRAHYPHRRPVAADLVERSDETGDGGHRGRRRAVARLPVRDELHPAGCLLPDAELDDL